MNPNEKLEVAILSSMLDSRESLLICLNALKVDDFESLRCQNAFALIKSEFDAKEVVDLITFHTAVKTVRDPFMKKNIEHVLTEIVTGVATSPLMTQQYCAELLALSKSRKARKHAEDIYGKLKNSNSKNIADDFLKAAKDIERSSDGTSEVGSFDAIADQLQQEVDGRRACIPFPFDQLTRATKALLPGTITVLCGSAGSTKSLWLMQMLGFFHERGLNISALVLEDGPVYHMRRVITQRTRNAKFTDADWVKNNPAEASALLDSQKDFIESFRHCLHEFTRDQAPTIDAAADWVRMQALRGVRIIAIDPFTLLDSGKEPWLAERNFINKSKRVIEEHGVSLILVTHPRKQVSSGNSKNKNAMSMDDMAGGAVIQRASHSVIWLAAHATKSDKCTSIHSAANANYNRTCWVMKARNSWGAGCKIGYWFNSTSLTLEECGVVE